MSPLYTYNGALLAVRGQLASGIDCCCKKECNYPCSNANIRYISGGASNPAGSEYTGTSGVNTKTFSFPSCAGRVRVLLLLGSIPDAVSISGGGLVFFSSGEATGNPDLLFLKPEGITAITVQMNVGVTPKPGTGWAYRIWENCLAPV